MSCFFCYKCGCSLGPLIIFKAVGNDAEKCVNAMCDTMQSDRLQLFLEVLLLPHCIGLQCL